MAEDFDVTQLLIEYDDIVNTDRLQSIIRPDIGLLSVMAITNKIGVIQPIDGTGKCVENLMFAPIAVLINLWERVYYGFEGGCCFQWECMHKPTLWSLFVLRPLVSPHFDTLWTVPF